jgi:hypothetical protein
MGQYQQWLHYRAVDQQLHTQQEQLERELAELHERAALLKDSASVTDNVIIQALVRLSREEAVTPMARSLEHGKSAAGPVDQQSVRTNYLVQRWMERWGRHPGPGEVLVDVQTIFSLLRPQDVEQFYQSYHYWQLQQHITQIQAQIHAVGQQTSENSEQMKRASPDAIALATLARLQASGVNDIDLLDRMLERGEAWLDHTMQLLERCEDLKVIDGDYTRWCELALEGAYEWITSMIEANSLSKLPVASPSASSSDQITEEMLLQKLMSDDELEPLPASADSTSVPAAVPVEETTEPEEVEVPSTEGPARCEEVTPAEEIAMASVEESAPAGERGEQEMGGERVEMQVPLPVDEVPPQEQEVSIPETPRPALLESEVAESETEKELTSIPQATAKDSSDESIHAVEEIMYFTDEIPWQWEEPPSSETHIPALTDSREEPSMQDTQSVKQGFFHRLFKKKGTEQA